MGAIQVSAREGYSLWAETWDTTPSPIVALEERTLLPWIGRLHPRRAVDVGCGTGRWTTRLSAIGVDASLAMLAVAAAKSGLRGRLAVGAAAARQTAPEIGVSRVMRRGLIRRDENWARDWRSISRRQTGYSQPIPKAAIGGSPRFAEHSLSHATLSLTI